MKEIPEIEELKLRVSTARRALEESCLKRWPVGTRVGVMFRHGQVNPTSGTICGFMGSRAGICLEAPKRRHGRVIDQDVHSRMEVPYTNIVRIYDEGEAE